MKKILLCCKLFFMTFLLQAQVLTLDQILIQIEQHNPVVQMYDYEAQAMDAAALGVKNWMPPQVSFGTFMTPYNISNWVGNGMMDMSGMMFSVQQMFPNLTYQKAKSKYMQQFSQVTIAEKGIRLNDLRQNAKLTFYDLLVQMKRKRIWNDNQQLLELMLRNTENRYKNGSSKLNGYYKLKAALGTIKNRQMQLDNTIQNAKIRLNTLMNKEILTQFEIDTTVENRTYVHSRIDTAQLFNHKSDFKMLNEKMKLNGLEIVVEKKQLRPEWGINLGHMQPLANGAMTRFSAMLMVNLPVFSWTSKMNKANIQKLNYQNHAIDAQKAMLLLEIESKSQTLQNDIRLIQEQLQVYENEIIPAYVKSFQATELSFEQNTEDLFTLYDTWEKLYDTQNLYLDMQSELYKKQVEFDYLMEVK